MSLTTPSVRLRVLPSLLPIDGKSIQIQIADGFLQQRYEGETEWTNIAPVGDLAGPPGPLTEFRSNGSFLQYRPVGTTAWTDVLPLTEIAGPPGQPGEPGAPGDGAVSSVAGKTGSVLLDPTDIDGLQIELDGKASLESPDFLGNPKAPNRAANDKSRNLANTGFVQGLVSLRSLDKLWDRVGAKLFNASGGSPSDAQGYSYLETVSPFNPNYEGGNYIASAIRHTAEGTNKNGPRGAALGLGLSVFKEGFGTGSAKGGEIDGLYVVVRQDSPRNGAQGSGGGAGDIIPDRGDGCGVLIDAAVYEQVGFVGGIEGATTVLKNDNSGTARRIVYQLGCADTTRGNSFALYGHAESGRVTDGLLLTGAEANGAFFDNFLRLTNSYGTLFRVDRNGRHSYGRYVQGESRTISDAMHVIIQPDLSMGWANADFTVQLMSLTQDGDLNAFRNVNAKAFNVDGNPAAIERSGTWSPLLQGSNGTAIGAYTATGTWRRIGTVIYITAEWNITSVGGASGTLQINNMPFARDAITALSGRITSGANTPNSMIQGFGGTNVPRTLNLARYDTTSLVAVHAGNIAGTYSTAA